MAQFLQVKLTGAPLIALYVRFSIQAFIMHLPAASDAATR
eukprot:COSAG01_NODE_108_length_25947_cov_25.489593_21_plen_40_part_00